MQAQEGNQVPRLIYKSSSNPTQNNSLSSFRNIFEYRRVGRKPSKGCKQIQRWWKYLGEDHFAP